MKCMECIHFIPIGSGKGYCREDNIPGFLNSNDAACKNGVKLSKQLSDKMFNNKLGVLNNGNRNRS